MMRAVLVATVAWTVYLLSVWVLPYYRSNGTLAGADGVGTAINVAAFVLPPLVFLATGLIARAAYRRFFLVARVG